MSRQPELRSVCHFPRDFIIQTLRLSTAAATPPTHRNRYLISCAKFGAHGITQGYFVEPGTSRPQNMRQLLLQTKVKYPIPANQYETGKRLRKTESY